MSELMYVVDFEPGLFGPFSTRAEADEWSDRYVWRLIERDRAEGERHTYSWHVARLTAPAEPAAPTHVTESNDLKES